MEGVFKEAYLEKLERLHDDYRWHSNLAFWLREEISMEETEPHEGRMAWLEEQLSIEEEVMERISLDMELVKTRLEQMGVNHNPIITLADLGKKWPREAAKERLAGMISQEIRSTWQEIDSFLRTFREIES